MQLIEKEILDFLENLYGCAHVEYLDGSIYISDEETERGYKVTVEETN